MHSKLVAQLAVAVLAILIPGVSRTAEAQPVTGGALDPIVYAAGDIAYCSSSGDEATALLLGSAADTVLTLGDNVYPNGTATEFSGCYDPTWGAAALERTQPSAGNHDYNTPGATGYYGYFGAAAGNPMKGYYSFDVGDWHLIALNSNCSAIIGGCAAGMAQEQWLRDDLFAHPTQCTLAYWHHPRFSSGTTHGNNVSMQPLWQALYEYGADVVLSGHEHNYERFAPQTPTGSADAALGIREFVVGTGGRSHYGFGTPIANSAVRNGDTYGVLKLTLHSSSFDWQFVPEAGGTFTDVGSASCHTAEALDTDGDGVSNATDNCLSMPNPTQVNTDAAASWSWIVDAPVGEGASLGGDACDPNDDNNGCGDAVEPLLVPARDPLSPWDFADVPVPALPATGVRDGAIGIGDAISLITWVGTVNGGAPNPAGRDYDDDANANGVEDGAEYDRSPLGAISGPPSGSVAIADALVIIAQVGDAC